MEELKLSSDKDFRETLISFLIKEINELSQCAYPIVTELEVTRFITEYNSDIQTRIVNYKQKYGNTCMEDVFYYTKEYCKMKYFDYVLKFVNYKKRESIEEEGEDKQL